MDETQTSIVTLVKWLVAAALGMLLYFAHAAFVPVALALLLFLVLSGPVEALHNLHVNRALSAALIMTIIAGLLAAAVNFSWEPAQAWFAGAPRTIRTIERKIRPVAQVMARIETLRNSAGAIGAGAIGAGSRGAMAAPVVGPGAEESAPAMLFDATRGVVLSGATVLILTLFLLAGGPPMLARLTCAFASDFNASHIIVVIEKVRSEVGRFYVTMFFINAALGVATALVMLWCGMPNPYLWGIMAGVFNFIPYAGSTVTLVVLTVVAIVSFDNLGRVLAVAASYLALVTIEGQFCQPLLVGKRLQLNPMLVFLGLWFGGLFWGIAGIILATPTLVALKVIAGNARNGGPLLEFLSPHPEDEAREDADAAFEAPLAVRVLNEGGPMPPAA